MTSDIIFKEIFNAWKQPYETLSTAKKAFYEFFQADAVCYDDVLETLHYLRSAGIKVGALTDVAYGMDNSFALQDIYSIRQYLDLVLTSVDVGFRKPNKAGFVKLLQAFDVSPAQMMYVGDEEKDIFGANSLGIISVLINRNGEYQNWGQKITVNSLKDIINLL